MERDLVTVNDDIGIEVADMMLIFMMVVVASLMTSVVSPMAQQLQAQSFRGLTNTLELKATPDMQWVNLINDPPYAPLITASFFNNGPNSVFIAINNPDELIELNSGESRLISMAGGDRRIEFIFYRCNLGERATVRVDGKY